MGQSQAVQINPSFMKNLRNLGAFDINACFSCGNCTAICPLSSGSSTFPRRLITYAQLGLERKILESPDMWLCDYCGECSRTCPRQAEPSEFMMALRRFAVSKYSPTSLSRRLYSSKSFNVIFMLVVGLVPLGMIATLHGPVDPPPAGMFSLLPEFWIHYVGIALGLAIGLNLLVGLVRMYRLISKGMSETAEGDGNTEMKAPGPKEWVRELIPTLFRESLVQYRSAACESSPTVRSRLRSRWLTHMTIFWGFLGLLAATTLRFVVYPTNGQLVPLTEPVRMLGTVSGLLLSYGTLVMIASRARKSSISTAHTQFTDWTFLVLLFLSGLTGFALEAIDYAGLQLWTDVALVVHLVVIFELLITAPFTKFAHALYRPFAIWMSRTHHYLDAI